MMEFNVYSVVFLVERFNIGISKANTRVPVILIKNQIMTWNGNHKIPSRRIMKHQQ